MLEIVLAKTDVIGQFLAPNVVTWFALIGIGGYILYIMLKHFGMNPF